MTPCRPAGDLGGQINAIGYGAWAAAGAEWGPHSDAASIEAIRRAPEHAVGLAPVAVGTNEQLPGAVGAAYPCRELCRVHGRRRGRKLEPYWNHGGPWVRPENEKKPR
jgi:hypothetical protein